MKTTITINLSQQSAARLLVNYLAAFSNSSLWKGKLTGIQTNRILQQQICEEAVKTLEDTYEKSSIFSDQKFWKKYTGQAA